MRECLRCFMTPEGIADAIANGMTVEPSHHGSVIVSRPIKDLDDLKFHQPQGVVMPEPTATEKLVEELISTQPEGDKRIVKIVLTEALNLANNIGRIADSLERLVEVQKGK